MEKPGQFKKGEDPRRNIEGRPVGTRDFNTDFDEAVDEIAAENKITRSDARKILLKVGYKMAKEGNFNFWQEIHNRRYGKVKDEVEIKVKELPIDIKEISNKIYGNKPD